MNRLVSLGAIGGAVILAIGCSGSRAASGVIAELPTVAVARTERADLS